MVRIAPVNLRYNPKTLWFDAGELEAHAGDGVVVATARGTEFGRMGGEVFEATSEQLSGLRSSLKPVKRIATAEDELQAQEMERRSAEALPVFKELAAQTSEEMHPVSVEYLFDGDKAIFYFEAEERIDFRELVRSLASRFHVRVDMRQIGVRDEARMVGGLGHCGQELCCRRMGGEFCPVSIRMAKEQDLSLNPQKISGVCGRLMCCLRYEYDAYKDFKSRAPKQNSQVETPEGMAKVVDLDVPRELVSLKVEGGKPVKVALCDFDPPQEGARPKSVGAEAWERARARASLGSMGEAAIYTTTQLTGKDKLADPTKVRRTGRAGQASQQGKGAGKGGKQGGSSRKPRPRRSTKVGSSDALYADEDALAAPGKKRKPQSQKGSNGQKRRSGGGGKQRKQRQPQGQQTKRQADKSAPRPGQKSSGLRNPEQQPRPRTSSANTPAAQGSQPSVQASEGQHRRSRRRSHKAGGTESSPRARDE